MEAAVQEQLRIPTSLAHPPGICASLCNHQIARDHPRISSAHIAATHTTKSKDWTHASSFITMTAAVMKLLGRKAPAPTATSTPLGAPAMLGGGGAVAVDDKYMTTLIFDPPDAKVKYGQVNSTGLCKVGTLTACLVSTPCRACLDAYPIPPATNEMGTYVDAVDALLGAYGRTLFDVVMFDAGACSLANATATVERGLDYVFCLRDNQSELLKEAERVLACRKLDTADAVSCDLDGDEVVIRRLWRTSSLAGWLDWTHLRTVLRLHTTRTDKTTGEAKTENRYYISSLAMDRLTAEQWQELIRRRWSVENQNHNIWDRIFQEDDRPWLRRPQGMVVMMMLRRLTYNVLAIYRSVTTRSERKRAQPWKELMQDLRDALIRATHQLLEGLRRRATATV